MNPLAAELNQQIQSASNVAFELLSDLGRRIYFPKGILFQSAQAKEKAHKFNATIGTATEKGGPMHLAVTRKYYNLPPAEVYPYAPPAGRPELRRLWREKMMSQNPSLQGKSISLPVVTSAITHGLSLVGQLFMDPGDVVISPDKLWGNYRLTFETVLGAKIKTFEMFDQQGTMNLDSLAQAVAEEGERCGKALVLLNFPNNPTGYTPNLAEADRIVEILINEAAKGTKVLAISDDSYFGLFYEDSIQESLFARFAEAHENILALKLDGATKEYYAWGFRTGFLTFGHRAGEALYGPLEKKVMGAIRAGISNCTASSQAVVEHILEDAELAADWQSKFEVMKSRALAVKEVLNRPDFKAVLDYYPFNSGYFMCLKLSGVDAEALRMHLLDQYGVGTISINATDLRVAFSCIEAQQVEELFTLIRQAVLDLRV
ncbi:MAG: aminotransferase class I/II-fold pyridoxal phosphate-dependent enzyme [bacterium]|nr:aminotransferase class I/II-fold pyridoxal phosphate-dependent enzyme [bacterium]